MTTPCCPESRLCHICGVPMCEEHNRLQPAPTCGAHVECIECAADNPCGECARVRAEMDAA